jgi:nucleoid-associated protein YgaU
VLARPSPSEPGEVLDESTPRQPEYETLPPPRWPADLELVVRPGQSLSKIAAAEYGRATDELVQRLATYNGLDDPNKLRAGQSLRVPTKEKLLASE